MNNLGQRWNGSFGRRAFLIRMCLLVIAGVSISQSVFSQDEKCQPRGEGRLIYVKRFNAEGKVLSLKEYNPQGISFSRIKQVQTDDGNLLMGCDKISGYWYKLLEENKNEYCKRVGDRAVFSDSSASHFEFFTLFGYDQHVTYEIDIRDDGYLLSFYYQDLSVRAHSMWENELDYYKCDERGNPISWVNHGGLKETWENFYDEEERLVFSGTIKGKDSIEERRGEIYSYDSLGRVDSVYYTSPETGTYLSAVYSYSRNTIDGVLRRAAPQENVAGEKMKYGINGYRLNDISCVGAFYDVDYVVSDKGDTLYTQLYRCHLLERQWEYVDTYDYGECSFTMYENGVLKTFDEGSKHYDVECGCAERRVLKTFDEGSKHYEFDERGMLRSVKLCDGSVERSYDEHGTLLTYGDVLFTNEYDENGKLISCEGDTVTSNTFIGGKNEFSYDEQDRLTRVKTYRKDENGVYVLYSYNFFEYGRSSGYTSVPLYTVSLDTVLQDMYYYVSDDGKTISSNGVVRPGDTLPSDVLKADLSHYPQIVRVYETNIYGDTLGWSLKTIDPASMEEVEVNVKNLVYEFDENDLLSVLRDKDGNRFYYSENGYLNRYERNDSANVFFFYGAPASDELLRDALNSLDVDDGGKLFVYNVKISGGSVCATFNNAHDSAALMDSFLMKRCRFTISMGC